MNRHATLTPCRRFEWERIIRRARLGHDAINHLLEHHSRKVSGPTVKAVALALASYANADGSNARPGERKLALVLESSERSVNAALDVLEQVGLVDKVYDGRGSRSIKASVYQLTIPDDLLDVVFMLNPKEVETRTTPRYEHDDTSGAEQDDTSASHPDDTSASRPENRTPRPTEPDMSSTEPDTSSLQTGREVRTPEPNHPLDQTPTTTNNDSNVTHLRARARAAARTARR